MAWRARPADRVPAGAAGRRWRLGLRQAGTPWCRPRARWRACWPSGPNGSRAERPTLQALVRERDHHRRRSRVGRPDPVPRPRDTSMPDTPAADLIVPALAAPDRRAPGPPGRRGRPPLTGCPAAAAPGGPAPARRGHARCSPPDRPVPSKLWHAYEVLGPAAAGRTEVAPIDGAVGASPAATAAWLGHRGTPDRAARAYLDAVVARHGGPVPCCTPITDLRAVLGPRHAQPGQVCRSLRSPGLVAELAAALGPRRRGDRPGPSRGRRHHLRGLVHALALMGRPRQSPRGVGRSERRTHFCRLAGGGGGIGPRRPTRTCSTPSAS